MSTNVNGFVLNGGTKVCFYANEYNFTFLNTKSEMITIEPESDYVFGETCNGNKIAIYARNAHIPVGRCGNLRTVSYVVSKANAYDQDITYYDAVRFTGGTLNKLAIPQNVKHEFLDDGSEVFRNNDDSREYTFLIGSSECKVTIFSSSSSSFGIAGTTFVNDKINLEIEFSEKQPLVSVYDHIAKVKELLAFMTFRKNVGFSEITLLQHEEMFDGNLMDLAEVFIKQDEDYTEKIIYENIGFDDLGEAIEQLLTIIYNSKDDKPGYVFGFIPEKDKDVNIMNNVKIKEICSALECELSHLKDINDSEEANLQGLIKEVKKCVKEHRKGSAALSPKTYDLIFSSISHWSLSASDRIIQLYRRYEQEMEILNPTERRITDEMINSFVKYRNKITHGNYRVLNFEIAITAHVLQGLVYCCLLKRIGIDEEKIIEWCRMKMLR